jgi:sulfur carrier protein
MITLKRNGQNEQLVEPITLQAALQQWDYTPSTFAVAVNGEFVPKQCYSDTVLQAGDEVDVVSAMQGG